jgi:WD40 repeat protein
LKEYSVRVPFSLPLLVLSGEAAHETFERGGFSPCLAQPRVTASQDKTARLWDSATGQPIGEPLRGHTDWVASATFSPDGKRIVTASDDRTARLWDAATGQQMGAPLDHDLRVAHAAFSPDGARIVTASADKTARLWDIKTDTLNLVSRA